MAILRAPRPTQNFYLLDKSISEDESLSWAARGLLIFLLGKPDNWKVSIQNLINQTEKSRIISGRDAVRGLLKELSDAGYIISQQAKDEDGKFSGYDYLITEIKQISPETGYPATAYPSPANPLLTSINKLTRNDVNNPLPQKAEQDQDLFKLQESNPSEPKRGRSASLAESLFPKFWEMYPKKVGKAAALKAWVKNKGSSATLDAIAKALEWQKKTEGWQKNNGQFIPNPATYINQQRWLDEKQVSIASSESSKSIFAGAV